MTIHIECLSEVVPLHIAFYHVSEDNAAEDRVEQPAAVTAFQLPKLGKAALRDSAAIV